MYYLSGRTYVAANNLVILGILDDLLDLLDGTIDVSADTTNDNDVLSRSITSLGANLDGQGLVFTNDTNVKQNDRE